MTTQSKISSRPNNNIAIDLIVIGFGVIIGGFITLALIWLWFDYQANPAQSYLALASTALLALIPASLRSLYSTQAELMDLPLTGQTSAYWHMARVGGIISYLLLWISMVWGLVLSTKISKFVPTAIVYGLHEFLAILALIFMTLHAFVLLGDSYIEFSIFHLMIPFIGPYQPFWTGLGIIGFYLAVAMTGSFYLRKKIGQKVWRSMHYLTFVTYVLVLAHGFMAGTDSGLTVMKLIYAGTGLTVLFLVYYRLFTLKRARVYK